MTWASVRDDPILNRSVNGWLVWFWIANFPPVVLIYAYAPGVWQEASILYLALVSIYANVAGHWAAWAAARVEVRQEELSPEGKLDNP
jgi:hypothetical protein